MNIETTTRYSKDDPDCVGDYCEVLVEINGHHAAAFGGYEDKGAQLSRGFIDGVTWMNNQVDASMRAPVKLTFKTVANYED